VHLTRTQHHLVELKAAAVAQLAPEDRWAVAAYIRTLQISRYAPAEQLSDADLNQLNANSAR
jgi:mono/diheme cytochrome c family protein